VGLSETPARPRVRDDRQAALVQRRMPGMTPAIAGSDQTASAALICRAKSKLNMTLMRNPAIGPASAIPLST
jgi:hypothetical protein